MTEYEMATLYSDTNVASTTLWALFLSLESGFLLVAYNAAHRLTRTMAVIVVGGWSLIALGIVVRLLEWAWIADAVRSQMKAFALSGKGLAWHPVVETPTGVWGGPYRLVPLGVVLGLVVLSSIYFFFHCRRVNRKADVGGSVPNI